MKKTLMTAVGAVALTAGGAMGSDLLLQTGDLNNRPGQGIGGADRSHPHPDQSLGFNVLGTETVTQHFRVADDFEVTDPNGWDVGRVRVYAYSTGWDYELGSPIETISIRIWDGNPLNDPDAEVVYGDLETNRLLDSQFADIFRTTGNFEATNRAVFWVDAFMDVELPEGEYWLDYGMDLTSGATSGPWTPGIETSYQTYGNAVQRAAGGWQERDEDYPFFVYDADGNELFDNNFDDFAACMQCHLEVPSAGVSIPGGSSIGVNAGNPIHVPGNQTLYRVAEMIEVTDDEWSVDRIRVFAYSTGWEDLQSSPFAEASFQIWDGDPRDGGESIFGDAETDRLSDSGWTGIYRARDSSPDLDNRAIYYMDFEVNETLSQGEYAIDYSVIGVEPLAETAWVPGLEETYDPAGGTAFLWRSSTGTFDSTNRPESIAVEVYGSADDCIADWNGDGVVNINDFFAYLADFEAGDPRADLTGSGTVNINDFFTYLSEFEAGC